MINTLRTSGHPHRCGVAAGHVVTIAIADDNSSALVSLILEDGSLGAPVTIDASKPSVTRGGKTGNFEIQIDVLAGAVTLNDDAPGQHPYSAPVEGEPTPINYPEFP